MVTLTLQRWESRTMTSPRIQRKKRFQAGQAKGVARLELPRLPGTEPALEGRLAPQKQLASKQVLGGP